ncbi:universal stress protein [Gelidibacter salicanalis]|uniref:Universal stress protein n=1 Tax=Gelidibacter salicanalis TaxID=291193 RepID=A0A5C7AIF9_9FLAO|nr:universal stress protein [Gelidibacter salicanalis]TXE07774.1 universal stress protein [Gelidibacter salicanalis]
MKNILVAVDHPKYANQLTAYAVQIAKLTNGKIWIIHVSAANPTDLLSREAGPQFIYDKRTEDNQKSAVLIKKLALDVQEQYNVPSEGLLVEGSVVKSLKKIVKDNEIDLVVAGHKRRNLVYGLFTENKKKDLIDELQIPLLAIPLIDVK